MRKEKTSPQVATKASKVLRTADKLLPLLGSTRTYLQLAQARLDELAAIAKPMIDTAKSSAASALTQVDDRKPYAVEVIGYTTAWRLEQLATPDQAQAWREDGLHVEEIAGTTKL